VAGAARPGAGTAGYAVVIPARHASTRLPGKPLLRETGKYLVQHVVERASQAPGVTRVIVATDDDRIEAAVRSFGGEVERTRADHATGTDRVAEVAGRLGLGVVVNVQGDEPLLEPKDVAAVAAAARAPGVDIATLACPLGDAAAAANPNVVKVVRRADGSALYFSRAPIPFDRATGTASREALGHVGVYAFAPGRVLDFVALPAGRLDAAESLEQLRALEAGWRIAVLDASVPPFGIDTPEDYRRFVERMRSEDGRPRPDSSNRRQASRE
jgi:3-deoxy-manno-octulosonate cytidylyltransferase (CMP-KDO synthetase)